MREIKFRAWDKEKRVMLYDGDEITAVEFHSGAEIEYKLKSWDILKKYDIVMQCTGLKDRQGIEIYEGDILDSGDSYSSSVGVGVVRWNETDGGWTFCTANMWHMYPPDSKIIGNIYENPELLEENKRADK